MSHSGSRLSRGKRLLLVGAGLLVVLAVIGVIVGASAPPEGKPRCEGVKQCGEPPSLATPLESETRWIAEGLGIGLDYDDKHWKVEVDRDDTLQLTSKLAGLVVIVQAERSADDPRKLLETRVDDLGTRVLGLESDDDPTSTIYGPAIGHVDGEGGAYVGALDTPQGVQEQLRFALLTATHRGIAVKVTVLTDEEDPERRRQVYNLADNVLNTVTWS